MILWRKYDKKKDLVNQKSEISYFKKKSYEERSHKPEPKILSFLKEKILYEHNSLSIF